MIYGYVAIKNRIKCDIDTDYQEEAEAEVKKVRLFLDEKERDESARINYQNSGFMLDSEKFVSKSDQGKLKIIPIKEYYHMLKEIKSLKEELHKLKNNE